ncbi:DUF3090 family protein [Chloroflexia bacterium SDU3-3]|nr:DUF3090 family protein [Chloroflexia bacterium SDU3-3]
MEDFTYDLDPVSRITINAVGKPGQRTFYIQARRGPQLVSVVAEKEQVQALAQHIEQFLEELTEKNPLLSASDEFLLISDMSLEEPLEPAFRVAQIGLGYDEARDMVILLLQGLDDEDNAPTARMSATREQMRALSQHTQQVVSKGRKICGNCMRPIDPEGHFCPRMN